MPITSLWKRIGLIGQAAVCVVAAVAFVILEYQLYHTILDAQMAGVQPDEWCMESRGCRKDLAEQRESLRKVAYVGTIIWIPLALSVGICGAIVWQLAPRPGVARWVVIPLVGVLGIGVLALMVALYTAVFFATPDL